VKLALIHHQFIRRGGLEGYLLDFAKRLLERGHAIEIVASRIGPEAEALGVPIHRIAPTPFSSTLRLRNFDRAAQAFVASRKAEGTTIGFGRTTAQDLHRAGGGCHRVYSRLLGPWKRWRPKNRLELALERKLYEGGATRHFVVNAAGIGEQIGEEYGVAPERISVIHTAVDTERFHPPTDERGGSGRKGVGRPVFLFASLDHRRKGLDPLLEVWTEIDADLWIVGAPLDANDRRRIRDRGLEGRVRALGKVADLAPIYREVDFFVHPTFYDACANTVLQAMASGLPSIVSERDGASKFVAHGKSGLRLRDSADTGTLHARVEELLAMSPEERRAMGQAARERMLPLTWAAHLARWEEVIARMKDCP